MAIQDSDSVVILTEWEEFREIDWNKLSKIMRKPAWIFDCRDIINERFMDNVNINVWKCGYKGRF